MIALPILPDTLSIPLDGAFTGAVAVVRPLDIYDVSKWTDAFPTDTGRNAAATELVRAQLIRIENFGYDMPDGTKVPYDHSNPVHFRSIPVAMRTAIYAGVMERVSVSGEQEKNSDSPSDSGGTGSTAS